MNDLIGIAVLGGVVLLAIGKVIDEVYRWWRARHPDTRPANPKEVERLSRSYTKIIDEENRKRGGIHSWYE